MGRKKSGAKKAEPEVTLDLLTLSELVKRTEIELLELEDLVTDMGEYIPVIAGDKYNDLISRAEKCRQMSELSNSRLSELKDAINIAAAAVREEK